RRNSTLPDKVTVVDYGRGNLFSVTKAFEHCGAEVEVTQSAERVMAAERLVLPGVGAFGDAMEALRGRGLIESIREYAESGRPFLGICVGMQVMFDGSEEFGDHRGLGLIPGKVVAIPDTDSDGRPHKVPHVGWTRLDAPDGGPGWDGTILAGLGADDWVYFVHSFTAVPADDRHRLADSDYGGHRISAAVRLESLWGCQFHPEKSGPAGIAVLSRFLAQSPERPIP
ncbi:MAG: imidazole glycerol phosphate synthase subunit HisH, partial [Rhodospirillales bacterium]|nr:imidazole glycerol phosphate synthase subunit HisH [Rhodospirillales bacterium]